MYKVCVCVRERDVERCVMENFTPFPSKKNKTKVFTDKHNVFTFNILLKLRYFKNISLVNLNIVKMKKSFLNYILIHKFYVAMKYLNL